MINRYHINIITLILGILFCHGNVRADFHVIYENQKDSNQKIEIYAKKGLLKINNYRNIAKIVDLSKNTLSVYKISDKRYLQIKLDSLNRENSDDKDQKNPKGREIFNSKVTFQNGKREIFKTQAVLLRYSSTIDQETMLWAANDLSVELVRFYLEALKYIAWTGNEILKEPFYHYSLKSGYLPLEIKNKDTQWKAILFDKSDIPDSTFALPADMTLVTTKEYLKELVDKVSEDLESEINPLQ